MRSIWGFPLGDRDSKTDVTLIMLDDENLAFDERDIAGRSPLRLATFSATYAP
jgi:hypothetical protein